MTIRDVQAAFTFADKYASNRSSDGSLETREEAAQAVMDMHRLRFQDALDADEHFNRAFQRAEAAVVRGYAMPSMRAMQAKGAPILKNNMRQFNCAFSLADRSRFFSEAFWLLLGGTGVGFSVRQAHTKKLPKLYTPDNWHRVHKVQDSIEGWAEAAQLLVDSYLIRGSLRVQFDFSLIRPKGAPLSWGGLAPGSDGLEVALAGVRAVLEAANAALRPRLRPIDCFDIVMHLATAVLSGGIRRAATICIFDPEDAEMAASKTGNWYAENRQRENANISAGMLPTHSDDLVRESFRHAEQFGEPGIVFTPHRDVGLNPCQPGSAPVLTPEGLRTMGDIDAGSVIWSEDGWVTVVKKWSTGIKPVFRYATSAGAVLSTANHRIVQNGQKIEVKDADTIDVLRGPRPEGRGHDPDAVLAGLFLGDGSRRQSRDQPQLHVGADDRLDYERAVSRGDLATPHSVRAEHAHNTWHYGDETPVSNDEMPPLPERRVPERFLRATPAVVASLLRGLYSANGSVVAYRVTFKTASPGMRDDVQALLSAVGIASYYTTNKPQVVTFSNGDYVCKESYDINISMDTPVFARHVGFLQEKKNQRLAVVVERRLALGTERGKSSFEVREVEACGEEEVFDITVSGPHHTYWSGGHNISNCAEAGLDPIYEHPDGTEETGWSMCNLTSAVVDSDITKEHFVNRCEAAAVLGTMQAAYTNVGYLLPVSKLILDRDALLGVSIIGLAEAPQVGPEWLRAGADRVLEVNEQVAKSLGINSAARTTCIKPEGTGTIVAGRLGNGANAAQARRYIRQQRCKPIDGVVAAFAEVNPDFVRPFGNDVLVMFPLQVEGLARVEEEETVVDQIRIVRVLQEHWCDAGHRRGRVRHSVSNTIKVKSPAEWRTLTASAIHLRREIVALAAMGSFSPYSFDEAPFLPVPDGWETADLSLRSQSLRGLSEAQAILVVQARYRHMVEAGIRPVDYSRVDKKVMAGGLEPACAGGFCLI